MEIPTFLKHNWIWDLELAMNSKEDDPECYRCSFCKQWTANLSLYENEICSFRDRRKSTIKDRRKNGKTN